MHLLQWYLFSLCLCQLFLPFLSILSRCLCAHCGWIVSRWHITPTGMKVQPLLYLSLNASWLDWIIKNSRWGNCRDNSMWQIRLPHLWRSVTCVYCCGDVWDEGKLSAVSWTGCSITRSKRSALPAIRHHCRVTWTHEKHQWELNCWTSLLIFHDYFKSGYLWCFKKGP